MSRQCDARVESARARSHRFWEPWTLREIYFRSRVLHRAQAEKPSPLFSGDELRKRESSRQSARKAFSSLWPSRWDNFRREIDFLRRLANLPHLLNAAPDCALSPSIVWRNFSRRKIARGAAAWALAIFATRALARAENRNRRVGETGFRRATCCKHRPTNDPCIYAPISWGRDGAITMEFWR